MCSGYTRFTNASGAARPIPGVSARAGSSQKAQRPDPGYPRSSLNQRSARYPHRRKLATGCGSSSSSRLRPASGNAAVWERGGKFAGSGGLYLNGTFVL
jgi:hypothetical protein